MQFEDDTRDWANTSTQAPACTTSRAPEPCLKVPFVTHDQVLNLVDRFATPFHLYHEQGIRDAARRLKAAFAWNPGFKEYFAVKATPNPAILEILKSEGFGMDCASYTELLLAESIGVVGDDIMFSSNVTPAEDFMKARELDAMINLDDYSHIKFLERVAGLPKTISCRYNPGDAFEISGEIFSTPREAKYGFTLEQLVTGFRELKAKGVDRFGIHALLSSNTISQDYYPRLARFLFETAVYLKAETGVSVAFINLSGGIGIPYRPEDVPVSIEAIGAGVKKAYQEVLVPAGLGHVAIFAELGRYLLGPYGCLVTRVLHEKQIYKHYLGVDASAVDLLRPAMYGAYHHISVSGKVDAPQTEVYDVTGGLCENNDKFAVDRRLPRVEVGDLLIIHDTGAHGYAMGYNYNGKLKSAEILLQADGTSRMIRRSERPEDYFATLAGIPASGSSAYGHTPAYVTQLIIYTKDQVASGRFYAGLLGLEATLEVPGMTEFRLNASTSLGIMPATGIARVLDHKIGVPDCRVESIKCELYLRVTDPSAYYDRALALGGHGVSPSALRDWGDVVAYCIDLDGNLIAFASRP